MPIPSRPHLGLATAFSGALLFAVAVATPAMADEYVIGFQCSADSPESCSDPAERKRYEELARQRAQRAAAAARAAEEARQQRDREVKGLMTSMGMSPAREAELRRLAAMREAAGGAMPRGPAAPTPQPSKPECRQKPRRVSPTTASFPAIGAAEASARALVANACGVKGVATVTLNCRSNDSRRVAMKNGKVQGTSTTAYWMCAPQATCVDTVETCSGGNNAAAGGSKQ